MDCEKARDVLCDLDDASLSPEDRATAAEHRASCPECEAFARAVERLEAIPAPAAPSALADRIAAAIAREADQAAESEALRAAVAATAPPPPSTFWGRLSQPADSLPVWLTRKRLWAATAATTLVAASVSIAVILSGTPGPQTAQVTTDIESSSKDNALTGGAAASAPAAGTPSRAGTATATRAPDYIVFDSYAYVAAPVGAVDPSTLTTVGTTTTAARGGSAQTLSVLRATGSSFGDTYIAMPGEGYQRFTPVSRALGSRTYLLSTGPIERFGLWPQLPSGWSTPTSANGSPYYRAAGTDDAGVPVFVRIGQTPELGFVIAPGTPASDPAAGNPNWTLWLPKP